MRGLGHPAGFLLAIGLLLIPISAMALVGAGSEREWTVMVYMNAKNNLEPYALKNFHSMAEVGSTAKVSIVAQLGRPAGRHYTKPETSKESEWSGVYRFLIGKDTKPVPEHAVVEVKAIGESEDMGAPAALEQFIVWSRQNYPAKRYMLVIWNHGQGWRLLMTSKDGGQGLSPESAPLHPLSGGGETSSPAIGGFRAISVDDDTGHILYNREVQEVIAGQFRGVKLDVLGYDACLMAMIETAYGLTESVTVMIGSEELEPGMGWRYATWLDKVIAKPTLAAEDLGLAVVESYRSEYGDELLTTLSALRLSEIRSLAKQLSSFADALRSAGEIELRVMRSARANVRAYGESAKPPAPYSVDLSALLREYESRTSNVNLRSQAANVRSAISKAVISNYASERSRYPNGKKPYGSEGVAIYYPETANTFRKDFFHRGYLKDNIEKPVDFVRMESWADLLYKLLGI